MNTLRVAFVQQKCGALDPAHNLERSRQGIYEAAKKGAQLVLLPELHLGPYFCQIEDHQYFDWAETIPGPTTRHLGEIAKSLGIVIVASLFEKRAPGLYHNTAVVLERDGTIAGKYRKMHIPDDPGYYEKFYFTPGDLGFTPISTSVGKLGILVCWDQWYPEAARLMSLAGAQVLLYPTAIGWSPSESSDEKQRQLEAWTMIQRAHAIANGLPVVVCNRVGDEPDPSSYTEGLLFWGNSFIAGPQGELLEGANESEECVCLTEIQYAESERIRRIWPFLRDRRIDEYVNITRRFID